MLLYLEFYILFIVWLASVCIGKRQRLIALCLFFLFFFFQAEDGIRDLVRSRGLGDVYKRQGLKLIPIQSTQFT